MHAARYSVLSPILWKVLWYGTIRPGTVHTALRYIIIIIIIIEGLSPFQSIPPTTANKQTQAQKKRGSRARKLLGANAKRYSAEC